MPRDIELGRALVQIVRETGFDLSTRYASPAEMRDGIRGLSAGIGDVALQAALLENFRAVVLTTMASGNRESIQAQSRLPRWSRLRAASPVAAEAYSRALRYAGLPVPSALGGGNS